MSPLSWKRIVCSCLFACIPGVLFAAENGVVLIDQSRALAGGVSVDDAPGFPVTISQPGSYRLMGNLTIGDGDTTAIQITADYVTLDLNGFSIIGPVGCTGAATTCPASGKGVGIQARADRPQSPRGVKVFNGTVRGMGSIGLMLTGRGSFVSRVTADNNAGGGMTVSGSVIECTATQNGSFGIIGTTVRDSTSLENAGDGILISAESGVASGNVSSSNGGVGIAVQFGTAIGNTTFINKLFGISASCPSTVVNNTVISLDGNNIETRSAGCVLANNSTRP